MSLVQISRTECSKAGKSNSRIRFSIATIEKFFLIGAAAGLFGSLVVGVYVWLMRSGLIAVDARYHSLRAYHAGMQFYLFLTPFILGFLLQSGPKLMEAKKSPPRLSSPVLLATLMGAVLMLFLPQFKLGSFLIAGACLITALSLLPGFITTAFIIKLRFGTLTIFGLLSLAGGAFLDLGKPNHAVLLFWSGISSIIFSTGQQFITGVLGGRRRGPMAFGSFLIFYFITCALLTANALFETNVWPATSAFMLMSIVTFLFATGAKSILSTFWQPLGFAFFAAHLWALTGAALLLNGVPNLDPALHAWGIGFAVTLIIAISIRLIGWIVGQEIARPRTIMAILLAWQYVAFIRTFHLHLASASWTVWLATVCSILALSAWAGTILTAAFKLLKAQLQAFRIPGFNF